ncbi:hypothetical protein ACQZV8_11395 [Magnetococcales bacterium HHB-1]
MAKNPLQRLIKFITEPLAKRHFFGMGLPKRDPEIHFSRLRWSSQAQVENDPDKLRTLWEDHLSSPPTLFQEVTQHLNKLNRHKAITTALRFQHIALAVDLVFPHLEAAYYKYRRGGGIPDNIAKETLLDRGIELLKHLLQAFAIQMELDYRQPNRRFVHLRPRFRLAAFRTLELFWLLQHLAALRYRQDGLASMYQLCNMVFYAIWSYENPYEHRHLLSRTHLNAPLERHAPESASQEPLDFQQLYLLIQLFSRIDPLSWNTDHFLTIDAWNRRYVPRLTLLPLAELVNRDHALYIPFAHDDAPLFSPKGDSQGRILAFSLAPLISAMEEERELLRYKEDSLPSKVVTSPFYLTSSALDRDQLMQKWLKSLTQLPPQRRRPPMFITYREHCIFFTFNTLHSLIRDRRRLSEKNFKDRYGFNLALSKSSAVLTQHNDTRKESDNTHFWQGEKTPEIKDRQLFRTFESDKSRVIRVNQLMGLAESEHQLDQIRFGLIRHLIRYPNKTLDLDILWLDNRNQFAAYLVTTDGTDLRLPVLAFQKHNNNTIYLLHLKNPLFRAGETYALQLDEAHQSRNIRLSEAITSGYDTILARALI